MNQYHPHREEMTTAPSELETYIRILNDFGSVEIQSVTGRAETNNVIRLLAAHYGRNGTYWQIYAEDSSYEEHIVKKYFDDVEDFENCTYCNWNYVSFELM